MKEYSHVVAAKFRDYDYTQKIYAHIPCLNLSYLSGSMKKRLHILLIAVFLLALGSCASRKRGKGCDCPGFGQIAPEYDGIIGTTSFRV